MFTNLLRVAVLLVMNAMAVSAAFVPDFLVRPEDFTVLMAADAKRPPELKPFQAGAHGKFHVTGWTRPEQAFEWEITVPDEESYTINVLLWRHGSQALRIEVTGAAQTVSGLVSASLRGWTRQTLDGLLQLPAVKVAYSSGVAVRTGSDFRTLSVGWQFLRFTKM